MTKTARDLSGVYLKLQRAETHIQSFHDEVVAFSNRDPKPFDFGVHETVGPNHSIEYDLYAIIREQPPHEMALPFGEAIQNIRSARTRASEGETQEGNSASDLYGRVRVQSAQPANAEGHQR